MLEEPALSVLSFELRWTPGGFWQEKSGRTHSPSSGDQDAGQQEGFHGGGGQKCPLFLDVHGAGLC